MNMQTALKDIDKFFSGNDQKDLYKMVLAKVEKPLIERVLQKTGGNKKKTAEILGINRNTLYARIKKLKIDADKCKTT